MHEVATQAILAELGLNAGFTRRDEAYFIGWWNPIAYRVDVASGPMPPWDGYIGRLVKWFPAEEGKPKRCAYVYLPGMNSGVAFEGQFMDPGPERLTAICSMEDMRRMFVEGLKRLKEVVASEGATDAT